MDNNGRASAPDGPVRDAESAPAPAPDRWRFIPMVGWIRSYERRWLRDDLIAGFAVAALIVPKNLGYAGIAGIPLQNGLYAAAVGAILYAVFGTSRQISTGPSSAKIREILELTEQAGVTLRLARVKRAVREVLERDGVLDRIGDDKTHGNVDQAVAAQIPAAGGTRAGS
jgi:MFS superfamily sulfate permease-like transporter